MQTNNVSLRFVAGQFLCGCRYDARKLLAETKEKDVIHVLQLHDHEKLEVIVRSFIDTDSYREYMEDSEGILTDEELLRRVREELWLEKEAYNVTRKELEEAKATIIMLGKRRQKDEMAEVV